MKLPARGETRPERLVDAIHQLHRGRSAAVGSVTLTQNAASTTVTDDTISSDAKVQLTPASANGAAEMGAGTMYVSAVAAGSFTITHANSATAGRTFNWHAPGG